MEKEQQREWAEAQKITFGIDLVDAAKKQLEFLAVIDRNRHLYESPYLQWAIFRYNAFWIPLLAKHSENPLSEEPLVVPLDCEWIWHCHRLDPVRYKLDCEKQFGRILHNDNIISSVQGISKNKTMEIWKTMYPEEPYELELNENLSRDIVPRSSHHETFTTYDLISAVTRKISFSFQVLRPHMFSNLFLQEAVARYKGFLHLIRSNRRKNIRRFCVPTYDIDLIWHSHQLYPISYFEDVIKIVGEMVGHDDNVSDPTKEIKLNNEFSEFTKQWEETFGLRYWKAGAMYRGDSPTPVTYTPFPFSTKGKQFEPTSNCENLIPNLVVKAVEVLLEFVEIKNMPKGDKENLFVSFSKKQPDKLFKTKRTLSIFSESGEKQVGCFQCEPPGEFLFELVSNLPSNMPNPKPFKLLGSCSLSLEEIFACNEQLSVDKWLSIVPVSSTTSSEPVLHVSVSFTTPTPTDQVYHLVHSPERSMSPHDKSWTRVIDDNGNDVMSLKMRNFNNEINAPDLLKEVHYIKDTGETHTLARLERNEWCMKGTYGSFKLRRSFGSNGDIFELVGDKMVRVFPGRRLDYEPKCCKKLRSDQDFVTMVEFSSQHPYGRAIALIDLKIGTIKVKDQWIHLGITLAFILLDTLIRQGYNAFRERGNMKEVMDLVTVVAGNIESKIEPKDEMFESERCFAGVTISDIDQVTNLDGNKKGKMQANEEMIKSARCLTGVNCGVIDQVTTLDGNKKSKMEAKDEMIKSAGFLGGANCGIIDQVIALDKNIKNTINTEKDTMKNAKCSGDENCIVKSSPCGTGGTCATGGCGNRLRVKSADCACAFKCWVLE